MAATNKVVPPSGSICWVKHSMIRRRQSWWPVCVFHRMDDTLFSSVVSPYVSDTLLSGSRSSDCSFVFYFCDHIPVLEARDASDLLEWSQLVPEEMAEMHRNHQKDGGFLSIVDTFAAAIKTSEKLSGLTVGTEAYNQTLIEAIHEVRSSIEAKETLKEKKISDSTALTDETTLKRSSARLQQGTSQPLPAFPRRVKTAKMKRKEEEVESILRHDGDAGDLDTLEFEVHWAGTTEDDDEWFYYKEVKNMAAFDAYIALHPELASLGKKRQRSSKDTPVEVENKDAMVELREEHVNEIVKASEVRLSCPSCSKVFSSKPGYKYHTRKVCIQDVGFPCVRCKRAFFSEKKLNNHLKVCPEAQQVAGDVNDASVAFAHENTVGKDILSSEPPPPLFSQIQPDNDPRFSVEHARRPPEISHLAPSSSAVSGTAMQQPAAVEVSYASGADQVISTTPAEMLNTIVRDSAALSCEEPSLKSSFLDDKDDVVGGELIGGPDNHQEQGAPSTAEDIVAPSEKISASKARISSHPDDSIMTQFSASVYPASVPLSNDVSNSGESLGRELENTLALSPRVKKPNTVKTKPIPKSTIKVIFEVPIPARAMDTSAPSASAGITTEMFNSHEESKAVGDLPGDPLSYRNGDEQSDAFGASASLAPYTGRRVKPVKRYDDQDFERAKEELRLARKHAQIESKKTSAAMDGFNKLEDLPGYDGCYSTSMTSSGRNVTKTVKNAAQCTNIEKRNDRKKSKKKSNALKTAGNVNKVNEAFEKKKTPKPIIVYKGEKLTFNFESAFGEESQFLIESWSSKIYQRLYASCPHTTETYSLRSAIGDPVWSDEWFQDPVLLREEGQLASPDIAPPSVKDSQSSLEGKGETLTLIGDSVAQESSGRSRRKVPVARPTTLTAMYHELLKPRPDPHSLIKPMAHGVPLDEGADPPIIAQPFAVKVHPQVAFICDAHAHMCESEVIGLLAGRWDAEQKVLYVQAPFPMTATDRHDDGSTDVELDPIAELEVREIIARLDMVVVGWYHSHPKFRPDPSITDIFNQSQYQHLMRDELSGLEPFVGLIVSTFDAMRPTSRSIHKWFHSVPYDNEGNFKRPVNIPFEIIVHQREYITQHLPFSRYLDNHNLTQHFESILATGSYCSLEALEGTDGPHRDSKGTSGAASPEASGPSIESGAVPVDNSDHRNCLETSHCVLNQRFSTDEALAAKRPKIDEGVKEKGFNRDNAPTLLGHLGGDKSCEVLARKLVSISAPILRCATLAVVSTGLYYCQNANRTNLESKWKYGNSKLGKLGESVAFYLGKMGLSEEHSQSYMADVLEFFRSCWHQYDPRYKAKQRLIASH